MLLILLLFVVRSLSLYRCCFLFLDCIQVSISQRIWVLLVLYKHQNKVTILSLWENESENRMHYLYIFYLWIYMIPDTEYKSTAHITSSMSQFILSTFVPTQWKQKNKYHTVWTIPKLNIKIVERGKIDTTNTQI